LQHSGSLTRQAKVHNKVKTERFLHSILIEIGTSIMDQAAPISLEVQMDQTFKGYFKSVSNRQSNII